MKLSVIIVNYNVAQFLEQCLHSVQRAIEGLQAEVFVVDNNSVDESVAMVREKFPWVKLIANTRNTGFSKANNQAIALSSGEYLLLLNPDTLVEEDTFVKVTSFMDATPLAGGLGVRMIDGKGRFLPESKRGLPTPWVAFYKIFGLSRLFPRSKKFGRYHLGFLPEHEIHEVEILSGAFMLLRKSVIDQIGALDEAFFMYGEDIDLSWRIVKGGYKNYYYPHTRIIHYKGESTKKSSVNYVIVFYTAMVIFARKHFTTKRANIVDKLIKAAIYIRAFIALLNRVINWLIFPLVDLILATVIYLVAVPLYEHYSGINLAEGLVYGFAWMQALVLVICAHFFGAYDRPFRYKYLFTGIAASALLSFVVYALLPEELRFSRLLLLTSLVWAFACLPAYRFVLSALGINSRFSTSPTRKNMALVGSQLEMQRLERDMQLAQIKPKKLIFFPTETVSLDQLAERIESAIDVHRVQEVILCAKDLTAQQIISLMATLKATRIDFKIAPPESMYLIGSNSIERTGEHSVLEISPINKAHNRRKKRAFDIIISLTFLTLAPVLLFAIPKPVKFFSNTFSVLIGRKTWVGYAQQPDEQVLPKLKPGVLKLGQAPSGLATSASTALRINAVYARNYSIFKDLSVVLGALKYPAVWKQ